MTAISGVSGAAQQITSSQRSMNRAASALGTGMSQDSININTASKLNREAAVAQAGAVNGEVAQAKASVAQTALDQSSEILVRMEELSVRASSGDLTTSDRAILNTEAQQLSGELSDLMTNTKFNGSDVFDGASVVTRVDGNVTTTNADGAAISAPLSGLDLTTQAGADAARTQIADAQLALAGEQSKVATGAAKMSRAVDFASAKSSIAGSAASEIGAADIAKEVAGFIEAQVEQTVATHVFKSMQKVEADAVSRLLFAE
jgi:flagellin